MVEEEEEHILARFVLPEHVNERVDGIVRDEDGEDEDEGDDV